VLIQQQQQQQQQQHLLGLASADHTGRLSNVPSKYLASCYCLQIPTLVVTCGHYSHHFIRLPFKPQDWTLDMVPSSLICCRCASLALAFDDNVSLSLALPICYPMLAADHCGKGGPAAAGLEKERLWCRVLQWIWWQGGGRRTTQQAAHREVSARVHPMYLQHISLQEVQTPQQALHSLAWPPPLHGIRVEQSRDMTKAAVHPVQSAIRLLKKAFVTAAS